MAPGKYSLTRARRQASSLSTGTRNAATLNPPFSPRGSGVPQYSSLSDIEAAVRDGRLSSAWELLLPERMTRDGEAARVLAMLAEKGVMVHVSASHHGEAIASRAERRSA